MTQIVPSSFRMRRACSSQSRVNWSYTARLSNLSQSSSTASTRLPSGRNRSPPSCRLYGGSAKIMSTEQSGSFDLSSMQAPWMMTLKGRISRGAIAFGRNEPCPSAMRDTRFIRTLPPFEPPKVSQGGLPVKRRRVNESLELGGRPRLPHTMLDLDRGLGLNCWWVWRKGLAGLDFGEDQLRLGFPGLDLTDQPEAAPVQRGHAKVVDRPAMVGRRVAAVMVPTLPRIFVGILDHHPVARDLGDDRGRRDRPARGVAVDNGLGRPLPARGRIAVDQHPCRFEAKSRRF